MLIYRVGRINWFAPNRDLLHKIHKTGKRSDCFGFHCPAFVIRLSMPAAGNAFSELLVVLIIICHHQIFKKSTNLLPGSVKKLCRNFKPDETTYEY